MFESRGLRREHEFSYLRGDASQKCNRWCGATRCNYWGNSRHAEFDTDQPARRRYAVPLHENNPSVPRWTDVPRWKEARLKFQPDTSPPKSVCLHEMLRCIPIWLTLCSVLSLDTDQSTHRTIHRIICGNTRVDVIDTPVLRRDMGYWLLLRWSPSYVILWMFHNIPLMDSKCRDCYVSGFLIVNYN